jgi:hypothetical protein
MEEFTVIFWTVILCSLVTVAVMSLYNWNDCGNDSLLRVY